MKKIILCTLICAALSSCGGSSNKKGDNNAESKAEDKTTTFNPQKTETKVEFHPEATQQQQNTLSTGVKISVMVPNDFTQANQTLIQSKLLQMISNGGVSGMGGSPTIVIAPIFALLSENVTATAPAKTMLKYSLTLYVANIITGDVYGSTDCEITGVGDSQELALQNAISSISATDAKITTMIGEAEQRIIDYYTTNGDRIITEAQSAASGNQYDVAIALLTSIPKECGDLFDRAQAALAPIYEKNMTLQADEALSKMRSALGVATPESFAEAMLYYQQIPYNSEARKQADELYNSTKTQLDAERQTELQHAREQSDKQIEYEQQNELLRMKMNIEGQEELLNKYKKDAAYERLPWIRKVVHLGNWDPFDGSGASNFDK